jgi:hypothetical protein
MLGHQFLGCLLKYVLFQCQSKFYSGIGDREWEEIKVHFTAVLEIGSKGGGGGGCSILYHGSNLLRSL